MDSVTLNAIYRGLSPKVIIDLLLFTATSVYKRWNNMTSVSVRGPEKLDSSLMCNLFYELACLWLTVLCKVFSNSNVKNLYYSASFQSFT